MATYGRGDRLSFARTVWLAARTGVAVMAFLAIAAPPAAYAQFDSGSQGQHGAFPPVPQGGSIPASYQYIVWNIRTGGVRYCQSYTTGTGLDVCNPGSNPDVFAQIQNTLNNPPNGTYEFTSFDVTATPGNGQRYIVAVGGGPNMPLTILSQTDITLMGVPAYGYQAILYVNGANGQSTTAPNLSVVGGKGGPGGFDGGDSGNGGATAGNGNAGMGPVGGNGGSTTGVTQPSDLWGALPLASPLNPALTPLVGGSGGGGAAGVPGSLTVGQTSCGTNALGYAGGGGGGGGGAVLLAASGKVTLGSLSRIDAQGGTGGQNGGSGCSLYGGGGAGGSVRIVANEFTGSGEIYVGGGYRTNNSDRAPGGFVRIETSFNTWSSQPNGATGGSTISFPTAPIPLNQPVLQITHVNYVPPPTTTASLATPDITFNTAINGLVPVEVTANNVPEGTTVNIKVVPASGTPQAVWTTLAGSAALSTGTANIALPPGAGVITATATFNVSQFQAMFPTITLPMVNGEKPDRVEVMAMADGTSRAFFVAPSGARLEFNQAIR